MPLTSDITVPCYSSLLLCRFLCCALKNLPAELMPTNYQSVSLAAF